jgi:catechol 2,3-dioxygenase-like lactoylglutathione lyase family enzyme
MLDHVSLPVSDFGRSRAFYLKALEPLGVTVMMESPPGVGPFLGLGLQGKPFFWIGQGQPSAGVHVAFTADSRAQVRAFHDAAMASGGRDNGAPGPRPLYHPDYYAAFVLDPDGANIEAVCHRPE